MEYQKIISLLHDATNQPSKFRTTSRVEINAKSKGRNDNSNIRFKTSMISLNLCDYSDTYILVKGTITVTNTKAADAAANDANKKAIFKSCAPFTDCITELNNTQVNDPQKVHVVMLMHNLIEYSDAYWKTSGSLWQCYRDKPDRKNNGEITDYSDNNNNASFKCKQQPTGQTRNHGIKDVEIMVPLKYLSNFWRTLEMPLINYEISLQLKWSKKCTLVASTVNNENPSFQVTYTKLYVAVVTFTTQWLYKITSSILTVKSINKLME